MYVCMYECMYECMYVCIHAYRCTVIMHIRFMYEWIYVFMYVYVCIYACVYMYIYICMYICMYVCMCALAYLDLTMCMQWLDQHMMPWFHDSDGACFINQILWKIICSLALHHTLHIWLTHIHVYMNTHKSTKTRIYEKTPFSHQTMRHVHSIILFGIKYLLTLGVCITLRSLCLSLCQKQVSPVEISYMAHETFWQDGYIVPCTQWSVTSLIQAIRCAMWQIFRLGERNHTICLEFGHACISQGGVFWTCSWYKSWKLSKPVRTTHMERLSLRGTWTQKKPHETGAWWWDT